ncbi:MAG TPA: SpoIIE family protein phosphatase [Kofleriaceae bacterium]
MTSLVFLAGPIAGRTFPLDAGEYVIGRRSDCQIFVPDMSVSRQHARIIANGDAWCLEDLGSNNGTYINGVRIQQTIPIHTHDEITIANNRIRVEDGITSAVARDARRSDGMRVTLVPGGGTLVTGRESPRISSGMTSLLDQRAVRLIERKLDALTQVLHATAQADSADALLEMIVEALLVLFPQAADVGVLVENERTRELEVKLQRHRERATASDEPLRVPGTIIQHVVDEHRAVLLGDTREGDMVGTRMGAPLGFHGSHYGVIYVESKADGFRQEDVDLFQSIATQVGLAMHAAHMSAQLAQRERLERDLRVARQIQRSLLPASVPSVPGLDFAVHYEPAYQIGGDFYDFIWHDPSHLGVAIGDVSGKAISAALYMARLTSELRTRAPLERTPSKLLARVNREMTTLGDDGMFATLVYCIYDIEHRSIIFTNAGHCVPLIRRGERVFPLEADRAHTPPVGVTPDLDPAEARVQLRPGDLLVMVSDGILEARNSMAEEYGTERLMNLLKQVTGTAENVVKAILGDIDGFAHGQGDDMTIVAMKLEPLANADDPVP